MKYIRMFLEWLFSFFYKEEKPEVKKVKESETEWAKLFNPRDTYYRHGSSYLFRLRRNQLTQGLYSIHDFIGC